MGERSCKEWYLNVTFEVSSSHLPRVNIIPLKWYKFQKEDVLRTTKTVLHWGFLFSLLMNNDWEFLAITLKEIYHQTNNSNQFLISNKLYSRRGKIVKHLVQWNNTFVLKVIILSLELFVEGIFKLHKKMCRYLWVSVILD